MSTIRTEDGIEIFYKDWGSGQPIVFHPGFWLWHSLSPWIISPENHRRRAN